MSKTKEELAQLKQEYEALCNKFNELTEEEIALIIGGTYRKDIGSDKNAKVLFDVED